MLSTIVNIQPKDAGSGGGETRETVVYRLADDMLEKLPQDYVPHEVGAKLIFLFTSATFFRIFQLMILVTKYS